MLSIKKHLKIIIIICIFILSIMSFSTAKLIENTSYDNLKNLNLNLTENNYYITEENYEESMQSIVEPYIEQYLKDGYIINNGVPLYYQSYTLSDSSKSIVISHGFTEFSEKYTEVIFYYIKEGYSVYIMDHRGFGNSYREVSDKSLAYIDSFETYINDFKFFIDSIVMPQNENNQLYLYAHSMGGAIGVDFLENYPEYFDAAILSAPLMKTDTGNIPELLASLIAKTHLVLGKGENYVLGHYAFDYIYSLELSAASSDERYSYYFDKQLNNENYQVYGASYSWLEASIKETHKIMQISELEKIKIPILLFQAEDDSLVLPEGHYDFVETVDTAKLIYVPGSKHQIYSSADEIVIPYFNTIFNFLSKVSIN